MAGKKLVMLRRISPSSSAALEVISIIICASVVLMWAVDAAQAAPPRLMRTRPALSSDDNVGSTSKDSWRLGGGISGLWPKPQMVKGGPIEAPLSSLGFEITTKSASSVLNSAIKRYWTELLFPFQEKTRSDTKSAIPIGRRFKLIVSVEDDGDSYSALRLYMNESYTLVIPEPPAGSSVSWIGHLRAETVFGALRGLETFSQTIRWNDTSETYSLPDLPLQISDWPRFPWRYTGNPQRYLDI